MEKDIEDIKKEKIEQMKKGAEDSEGQERAEKQAEAQKKAILRKVMTSDARERLGRVKIARPEIAKKIEQQIVMLAQRGSVQGKIDDETLKKLLKKLTDEGKDINIKRR